MTCLTAYSQTVRDLPLNAPVDSNTIAVAYSQILQAVQLGVRFGELDSDALERAIRVGQDLHLIETSTNGWAVAISNIVEVRQAHVPGVFFVGGTIYGVPENGQNIDIDGCDFYYNRQIPGDPTSRAGYGNIVTDPYMDWRLGSFFQQWGATNAAMWAALMDINDLPASLAADLQAYSSATGGIAQSISQLNGIKDEINATNSVIRSAIASALSQAEGGASWTQRTVSGTAIQDTVDHETVYCVYSGNDGVTVAFPTSTGASRFNIVFANAPELYENGSSISWAIPAGATVYYSGDISTVFDDWYRECRDLCVFEVAEVANNVWSIRKSGYWRHWE